MYIGYLEVLVEDQWAHFVLGREKDNCALNEECEDSVFVKFGVLVCMFACFLIIHFVCRLKKKVFSDTLSNVVGFSRTC